MSDDHPTLFEIKEEHLETGLRGYPVGYCVTSVVDPIKGIYYVEVPIDQLAYREPIEVIFLLWKGYEGSQDELRAFSEDLHARMTVSPKTVEAIEKLPRTGHPMRLFEIAILLCGMLEGKGNYEEDGLDIIAKAPMLCALVINHHAGLSPTPNPRPDLGYMENFCHMLKKVSGTKEKHFLEVMKLFNVLHYDHGGGNLSCFTAKAVASGLEDMWGSIASAMAALAGPRHGKANQDCLDFVKEVNRILGNQITGDAVEALIRSKLDSKELVFGFGHAVLRVEDPRATILYEYAKMHFSSHELVKTALLLRERGPKVLKENPKISDPFPNVDAISGSVLSAVGFDHPEYYTILFGLSRIVGIAAQVVYERCLARDGKGTPIIRPKYLYKKRLSKEG